MTRYAIRELITNHWFDISAAREILGYEPRVSYADGFKHLKDYLENREKMNGHEYKKAFRASTSDR